MHILDFLLLFCRLSLCGGNTGLVSAKLNIYTGAEGGSGTIDCYLNLPGNTKFFCRKQCKEEDILVKTDGVTANNGRYSVKYSDGPSGRGIVSVTITNLIKSDSGPYRCGLGKSSTPDSYSDFEIRVSDGEFLLKSLNLIFGDVVAQVVDQALSPDSSSTWFSVIVVDGEFLFSYMRIFLHISFKAH
uniref:Immunoglobulin domain-containing protein n=1 Tax=Anabas testudineus TaxID=64144 RepID=A0A7N6AQ11_ANATE